MVNENVKKLKEMIKDFLNSPEKEKEIEFEKPIILKRGELTEALRFNFQKEKDSILTFVPHLYAEIIIYDNYKVVLHFLYLDNNEFEIHKIKLIKN